MRWNICYQIITKPRKSTGNKTIWTINLWMFLSLCVCVNASCFLFTSFTSWIYYGFSNEMPWKWCGTNIINQKPKQRKNNQITSSQRKLLRVKESERGRDKIVSTFEKIKINFRLQSGCKFNLYHFANRHFTSKQYYDIIIEWQGGPLCSKYYFDAVMGPTYFNRSKT